MWDSIELHELRLFLVVAEELHFGRAATRLHVTPSRVSQVIRDLERRVGGPLFLRTSRRVALTPLGESLRAAIVPPLDALQAGLAAVADEAGRVGGVVRLGLAAATSGGPYLPEIIGRFTARHPQCRVELTDVLFNYDVLAPLREGAIDVLAVRLPIERPDLTVDPVLTSERRVVLVAKDHPLAGRAIVTWDDVADYGVHGASALPEEMRRALVPELTPTGRKIPQGPEVTTLSEILFRVATTTIVHPTVPSIVEHYRHPGVVTVPLEESTPSRSGLLWRTATTPPTPAAFVEVAREVMAEHPEIV